MASLIEILQRENSRLQSTAQEIQGLAKRAQAKRLEGERIRNNRVNINTPTTGQEDFNLNPSTSSPGGNPISQPTQQASPPPQSAPQGGSQSAPSSGPPQAVNNKAVLTGSQYKEAISISGARSPEAKLALSENIASPEVRDAVQTALQVDLAKEKEKQGLSSFENQKVGSTGLRGGKVDLASNIFENSSFAINARRTAKLQKAIDDDFLSKQRDDQQLRQLNIEKSQLELKQLRQQGKSDFGSPAQQAIVQTADGTFTNRAGAVGSEVTPAQPAILPAKTQQEIVRGQSLINKQALANQGKVGVAEINKDAAQLRASEKGGGGKSLSKAGRIESFAEQIFNQEKKKREGDPTFDAVAEKEKSLRRANRAFAVRQKLSKPFNNALEKVFNDAEAAATQNSGLTLQRDLLKSGQVDTGQFADIRKVVGNTLASFGINTTNFGLGDPSKLQLFDSVSYTNLLEALKSQKGVQTEGDAQRAFNTFAQLKNTPEANLMIIDYMMSMNIRKELLADKTIELAGEGGFAPGELTRFEKGRRGFGSSFNITTLDANNKLVTLTSFVRKFTSQEGKTRSDAIKAWRSITDGK